MLDGKSESQQTGNYHVAPKLLSWNFDATALRS